MTNTNHQQRLVPALVLAGTFAALGVGCSGSGGSNTVPQIVEGTCQLADGAGDAGAGDGGVTATEFLTRIDCSADFFALASQPVSASLSGARSVKVIVDQANADSLTFQNSTRYQIHYEFAQAHLSGGTLPVVGSLSEFNTTEYFSTNRRFILGAVTYYEGPKVWTLELAPYDTASATMIKKLFDKVKASSFFGPALAFHPTSDAVALEAKKLPSGVRVVTTDDLYKEIDYQPLTLATGMGRLRFVKSTEIETANLSFQDIAVLDLAPNDISVVQGLITAEFQTPLSHINVLSANRKTPNMGLRNAMTNPTLRSFEGKLVELTVGASEWTMREVDAATAEAFWAAHKPKPIVLPAMDLTVTGMHDIETVTPEPPAGTTLREAIKKAVLAYGGKAAQYSILSRIGADVPIQKAFAIPLSYYDKFMTDNGFYTQIDALLADATFKTDATVRATKLAELRAAMIAGTVDQAFQDELKAKLAADYPGMTMRFRTSTNSEDLEGFPCAGCYESHTGDPAKWDSVLEAIKETFSSIWLFRTFEERSYYGIDHKSVGMALLVHHNFPKEEANGVAITANPFDEAGLDPAFYVNVQAGGSAEVVHPPPGVTSDQFLYYFSVPNQPITYLSHTNLVSGNVLTVKQIHDLGVALDAIHERFSPAYGPAAGNTGFYAMDIEFKFDDEADPTKPATLYIKQARPYPGRSSDVAGGGVAP
jgi:hypothetical protein